MLTKLIEDKQKVEVLYSKDTDFDYAIGVIVEYDQISQLIRVSSDKHEFIFPLLAVKRIRLM